MRPTSPIFARLSFALASTLLAAACNEAADRPSRIDTLRVLAVRADRPFAKPASSPDLEMLLYDGSPEAVAPDGTRRRVRVLWMGTCVNPAGDLYYNCYPVLREALASLTDADLASETLPASMAPGAFGFGTRFTASIPADAIASRPASQGAAYPYGLAFVFFAACAGDLRHATPDMDIPVGCFRPGSNERLGQDDFEFGYYPIYAYDNLVNHVPVVSSMSFGAPSSGAPCVDSTACGPGQTCGTAGSCVPVVAACTAEKPEGCPSYALSPVVDPTSVERAVSSHVPESRAPLETIWVSYFSTGGLFDKDSRIAHDAVAGWSDGYAGVWRPDRAPGEVRLFAVVRDNRGGVTWSTQDVAVR
jgi:hypothetical protein